MDFKYEGEVVLRFRLEILIYGENYSGLEIDPTDKNITLGEVRTSVMAKPIGVLQEKMLKLRLKKKANIPLKEFWWRLKIQP